MGPRAAFSFVCACRVAGRAPTDVEFFDISPRGAKVKIGHLEINVTDKVQLYLRDRDVIPATVRRVGPDFAGIEFDDTMEPHVFERFLLDVAFNPR